MEHPFNIVKDEMAKGVSKTSFTSNNLENMDRNQNIEDQEYTIEVAAMQMYAAGVHTTSSALTSCILGMLTNPKAQERAQEELDRILKQGRLPAFGDVDSLPYVSAIVKEVLRWSVVVPMAVPHMVVEEDIYRGYRIPAKSIVFSNLWAILHDESVYPDPSSFNPDRFMKDGQLDLTIKDPTDIVFGLGRRVCPGKHIASASLWINIAYILAGFEITKAVDEHGRVIEPSFLHSEGLVVVPVPFKCKIRPRSKVIETLIRSSVEEDKY